MEGREEQDQGLLQPPAPCNPGAQGRMPGWEYLMVSLVPGDNGKPTARSEKAVVAGVACRWNSPTRESVKLSRDPKTGKINEKVYRFLVSSAGSAKCELLGEASINLAEYAEGIKPTTVSLPLKHSCSGIILHVTVQKMHADVDGRLRSSSQFRLKSRSLSSEPSMRRMCARMKDLLATDNIIGIGVDIVLLNLGDEEGKEVQHSENVIGITACAGLIFSSVPAHCVDCLCSLPWRWSSKLIGMKVFM